MQARLHLISPPWAAISAPSAQLGILQAYVEQSLAGRIDVRSYSAFLEILYRCRESTCLFLYEDFKVVGEEIFMSIYCSRFLRSEASLTKSDLETYIAALNDYWKWQDRKLTLNDLYDLEANTEAYVDEKIIPELIEDGVNVIGFTMNFSQVYSSLVMAKMIEEKAKGKKLLFLYGGFSASLPYNVALLRKLKVPGYVVFGEGEARLVAVLNDVLASNEFTGELKNQVKGVFRPEENIDFRTQDKTLFESQITDMESLPVPVYDEYFKLYNEIASSDLFFKKLVPAWVVLEGSRGCFAKCDFCNHNLQWSGFRKRSADQILSRIRILQKRYGINRMYFVDSVCDTFAEKLADCALESHDGDRFQFYMNLRAHHPESFWKKLADAGLHQCLVGIEAFSGPLLRLMSKGTMVVQNLKALKYLTEFGVSYGSGIITHHPRAKLEDAIETLRILEQISHLAPLEQNEFVLAMGSPWYLSLDESTKNNLRTRMLVEPPKALIPWVAPSSGYEMPKSHQLSGENASLWSTVQDLCSKRMRIQSEDRPLFESASTKDGSIIVKDTRFKPRTLKLKGLSARLFDICHEGLKLEMIEQKLGIKRELFEDKLSELVNDRLILFVDEYYLTLAKRPRLAGNQKSINNQRINRRLFEERASIF